MEKIFSKYVFTDDKLKKYMKHKDFKNFLLLKKSQGQMDSRLANKVAMAIKTWAQLIILIGFFH